MFYYHLLGLNQEKLEKHISWMDYLKLQVSSVKFWQMLFSNFPEKVEEQDNQTKHVWLSKNHDVD